MLILLAAIAGFTPAVPATISLERVLKEDAMALAPALLPETVRLQIVGASSGRVWSPHRAHAFRWWTAARASGGLCERSLYVMEAENRLLLGDSTPAGATLALGPLAQRLQFAIPGARGCEDASGYIAPMPGETAAAIEALERLRVAVAAARSQRPLSFAVTCREEMSEQRHCAAPRDALANLPLARLGALEFNSGRRRQLEPGLYQALPGNFQQPPTATFSFPPGGGSDGLTWRVTLEVEQGLLVSVDLGRTTVIYH